MITSPKEVIIAVHRALCKICEDRHFIKQPFLSFWSFPFWSVPFYSWEIATNLDLTPAFVVDLTPAFVAV